MINLPFRSLGRLVLTACAVTLSAVSLGAQTPTAASETNPSRADIFVGYSYFSAHGNLQPAGIAYSSINLGAIGSAAIYFDDHVGIEAVLTSHPSGANDGATGISAGPIFRLPKQNYTLFAHTLFGTERLGGPNNDTPATFEHEPYTWGLGLTAGGGFDYNMPFLNNRFSLRLVEADYHYIHENFGTYVGVPTGGALGGTTSLNAIELSTGLVVHFGHIEPPLPVSYSCSVSPSMGFPGDPITVTGTAMNLNPNPKKVVSYTWSTDGGRISGTSSTATVDTTAAAPGSYTVKGHVSQGVNPIPGQLADCSATFTVRAFEPPTISCSASPSSVNSGDNSRITSSAVSPQNRPLTYSYNATAGSISSITSSATLSTVGAAPGTITVTCGVADDKGHSVSATTGVNVIAPPPPPPPPPPPAPMASSLCSVSFERDAKRPTRVDNEAKACLDDITLDLQRSTNTLLALVGNEDAKEQKVDASEAKSRHPEPSRAAKRAVNTKEYLVTDKGIDPSRILVYSGTDDGKTVTTTLIPVGAVNPVASDTAVDESVVKAVPRTAPVKPGRKAKAKAKASTK
jgi:hypothetical protein